MPATKRTRRSVSIGERHGNLTVIDIMPGRSGTAICKCDCGTIMQVFASSLAHRKAVSCGCIAPPKRPQERHGMFGTTEYYIWSGIKSRCYNARNRDFKDYGGRGITMCDRWKESLSAFIEDMGLRPSSRHSIGRIDNNKGYDKDNCRWETSEEQMQNTRYNNNLTLNGRTMCITAWARELGIRPGTLFQRIRKGWSAEKALQHQVGGHKKSDRIIEYDGKTMNATEWSKRTGIPRGVIYARIADGWSPEACLTTPVAKRSRSHS